MINQTDLDECETSLPGEWRRDDNGDIYNFTVERMEMRDERLFRQLNIRHASGRKPETVQYALMIKGDYCGLLIDGQEFIIRELTKKEDGSAYMELEDRAGGITGFNHV